MSTTKEEIEVEKVHDNDKYIITTNIRHEMSGEELKNIWKEIKNARAELEKDLEQTKKDRVEVPNKIERQFENILKQVEVIDARIEAFGPACKQFDEPKE